MAALAIVPNSEPADRNAIRRKVELQRTKESLAEFLLIYLQTMEICDGYGIPSERSEA